RHGLGEIAVYATGAGGVDQVGMEVPGVHHDVTGARVAYQNADLPVIGFRLSEGVVEHDVDGVCYVLVAVEFSDSHSIAVLLEDVRHTHHHDVVIVDQRDGDRRGPDRTS